LKREHLLAMVEGDYGVEYVEQRLILGRFYSKYNLDIQVFLGAFHHLMKSIGGTVMDEFKGTKQEAFEHFMSLKKIAFFDIGIIIDVLIYGRERTIRQQQNAIRELSTPVFQLRDRLLILPIVGLVDSYRARLLTETLLDKIRSSRAKIVVIDVTGVGVIDSEGANYLIQTIAVCNLMGTDVIVTGLAADVVQMLMTLGVDLSKIKTVGDLQGGIEQAERALGYTNNGGGPSLPCS
ncbi:MAG: STAS domain-containing protein, partial [Bdellovibrionia bacterium]